MENVEVNLVERLSAIESPSELRDWETRDGYYLAAGRITTEDVPGLIGIVQRWTDWEQEEEDYLDVDNLLPVTAWRALGELRADEAVLPLVKMLGELDNLDDWACDDLPLVFGKIGKSAIAPLMSTAKNEAIPEPGRSVAVRGLRHVAQNYPDTRDPIVACLTEMLAGAAPEATPDDITFNTTLLTELVDLRVVEAAEPIERAFANNLLDVGAIGDWEKVRQELGVEGLKLEMPENPYNRTQELRKRSGVGIFSDRHLFWGDEIDEDAVQAYFQRAFDAFPESPEAQQAIDRFGSLGWARSLIDFGIRQLSETVDAMTIDSVADFMFDYAPRKITVEPERAAEILGELALFWEFLERVYHLPEAKTIAEWLNDDDLVIEFEEALSDSSNYGMAKSMFMAGIAAGYDMSSEAGLAEFALAFNSGRLSKQPTRSTATRSSHTVENTAQRRIGRNEPCPCGSGRKFKKCCGARQ